MAESSSRHEALGQSDMTEPQTEVGLVTHSQMSFI